METLNYTHRKRPYRATAMQWNGENTQEILDSLPGASRYDENHLMLRHAAGISTMSRGWWVVRGENSAVKCYSDGVFRIKYEEIKAAVMNADELYRPPRQAHSCDTPGCAVCDPTYGL